MPAISAVAVNVGSGSSTSQRTWPAALPPEAWIVTQSNSASVIAPAVRFSTSPKRSLPVKSSRIFAHAALTVLWPETYPGNGGVGKVSGEYGCHLLDSSEITPRPGPAQPVTD